MYLTNTTKRQAKINKLAIFFLKIFRFNVTTVSQDTKNAQVDYVIFNKGDIQWDKSPKTIRQS